MFIKKSLIIVVTLLLSARYCTMVLAEEPEIFNEGVVSYIRGDIDESVSLFEKAYIQAPDNEKVKTFYLKSLVELGTHLYEQEQYDRARPYLEDAYRLAPEQEQIQEMYEIVTDPVEETPKTGRMTPALQGFREEQEKLIAGYLQQDAIIEDVLNKFEQERETLEIQLTRTTRTNTYIIVTIVLLGGIIFIVTIAVTRKKDEKRLESLRKHENKIIRELQSSTAKNKTPRLSGKPQGKGRSISHILKQSEKKILVIDDNKEEREGMVSFLESENFRVKAAPGGKEGITYIANNKYNIVLTDLKMNNIGGIEVLKKAKELQPDIEVIIVTAYGSAESAVNAMKHGAYDYVLKPLNMDKLKITIERCLEKQKLTGKVTGLQLELLEKELVGEQDYRVAFNMLKPFLEDKNEWIRANAARILYRFNNKKALSVLKEMLRDPAERFHRAASWAAEEIGCQEALNLTGGQNEMSSCDSRYGEIPKLSIDIDPAYRKKVRHIEKIKNKLTGNENPQYIEKMLSPYLEDDNIRLRAYGVKILYSYDRHRALEKIEQMLDSPEKWTKISGLWVCAKINNGETVKILKKQLKSSDKFVSKKADQFLKQIGEKE